MKSFPFVSIMLVIALVLTGCGTPKTIEAPALTPVTLQLQWVTQAQFAGYYVALDKGWYEEEGIDLTIIPGGPDQDPINLVVSGTRDFGTALLADLTVAVQNKKSVIGIAQIQQQNGLLLLAKKSSGIQTPKDFTGKKVGVWLGNWEAQFDALMVKQGVAPDQFSLVSQGYSMKPFIDGELDVASAMVYNEYYSVLESGVSKEDLNVINYADYDLDFPGDTLFTTKTTAEQNPDLCIGMVRASLKGWQYAIEHPEEAVEIVLKYDQTGVQTQKHQMSMMAEIAKLVQVQGRQVGHSDETVLQRTIDTLLKVGILKEAVQPSDVMTNEFWNEVQK